MSNDYTVQQLNQYIRQRLDGDPQLRNVRVAGEVSNLRIVNSSGHCYFTLKDQRAQLACVMWRSAVARQRRMPKDGDAVQVYGSIGVYEVNGVYQLYAERIRAVGVGDLYQAFEDLKTQLEAEGLFDASRKRQLPLFPRVIGVVTSAEAAAFQDVQNVLRRRFPLAQVILAPTSVQGDDAPPQIVRAVARLNGQPEIDVILVCRGGGSLEDLWAFNDERVARAVAASTLPVVSGVGHETDFTITDFVADVRAPTPSAAAELLTPDTADLRARLRQADAYLTDTIRHIMRERRESIAEKVWALRQVSPRARVQTLRQRL
ncbi:MAG: exodeoxyribonuclease VII large subunit, partial [Chloroflexi bacterium]|nr:exodeoxyribonuclease VII large subunit [Chloroflexota bacterium]